MTDKSAPLKGHVTATKGEPQGAAATVDHATSLDSPDERVVTTTPDAAYFASATPAPSACNHHLDYAPARGSLIPPASVVREQLEVNGKERRRLQKLLKLAEEQEGTGE